MPALRIFYLVFMSISMLKGTDYIFNTKKCHEHPCVKDAPTSFLLNFEWMKKEFERIQYNKDIS